MWVALGIYADLFVTDVASPYARVCQEEALFRCEAIDLSQRSILRCALECLVCYLQTTVVCNVFTEGERRPYQYLYKDGEDLIFMNNETFEQITIPGEQVIGLAFMKESQDVVVVTDASTETVLYAEVPAKVHLQITWTEPGLKGDTATNTLKPAKVETGAEIRVPLFIEEGEMVEVDTRDGSYLGRVK